MHDFYSLEEYLNVVLRKFLSLVFETTERGKKCQQNLQEDALGCSFWSNLNERCGICVLLQSGELLSQSKPSLSITDDELHGLSVPEAQSALARIAVRHLSSGFNRSWEHILSTLVADLTDCKGRAITASRKENELSKGHCAWKYLYSFLEDTCIQFFGELELDLKRA